MAEHLLFDQDHDRRIQVCDEPVMALLCWGDDTKPGNWGFEHRCDGWPDEQEPDGVFRKVVAPRLTNHTITETNRGVTVRASILCADCGVHGFVTDSRWS